MHPGGKGEAPAPGDSVRQSIRGCAATPHRGRPTAYSPRATAGCRGPRAVAVWLCGCAKGMPVGGPPGHGQAHQARQRRHDSPAARGHWRPPLPGRTPTPLHLAASQCMAPAGPWPSPRPPRPPHADKAVALPVLSEGRKYLVGRPRWCGAAGSTPPTASPHHPTPLLEPGPQLTTCFRVARGLPLEER